MSLWDLQNVTHLFPPTSNTPWKPLSVLWISQPPFIYNHFKKQCIVNFLPQMRSNTSRALPTSLSITINVNSPLHLSPFYYNAANVKCICSSGKPLMAPRLSYVHYHNAHNSHFNCCFSLHFVNQYKYNIYIMDILEDFNKSFELQFSCVKGRNHHLICSNWWGGKGGRQQREGMKTVLIVNNAYEEHPCWLLLKAPAISMLSSRCLCCFSSQQCLKLISR